MLNGLALFLALAGGWLLLATRRRQLLAARLLPDGESAALEAVGLMGDAQVERLNRFFYGFATVSLLSALLLSWLSTALQVAAPL
ncbi:hypothetical protein D3C78_623640 [compost metagenome]